MSQIIMCDGCGKTAKELKAGECINPVTWLDPAGSRIVAGDYCFECGVRLAKLVTDAICADRKKGDKEPQ